MDEAELTDVLSQKYGVPAINLGDFEIDPDVIKLVPREVCLKHLVLPVNRAAATLILAMCDPSKVPAIEAVKKLTGCKIEVVVAPEREIRLAIDQYYPARVQR